MSEPILEFKGDHFWLSNFYSSAFVYRGLRWFTSEHAFQAMKSLDPKIWTVVQNLRTAREAKVYGRHLDLRKDWESVKLEFMEEVVLTKFCKVSLREKLLGTGDAYLSEGNWHKDDYWGYCLKTK